MGLFNRLFGGSSSDRVSILSDVESKASRASVAIDADTNGGSVYHNLWNAGESDLGIPGDEPYEQLLEKYSSSMWANIAVSKIATSAAQVRYRIINTRGGDPANRTVRGPAKGLADLLEKPNRWMSGDDFREMLILHLILTGNAYIEKVKEGFGSNKTKELYILNPKNMVVVPDAKTFVAGYKYVVNGKSISFAPDEIMHIKLSDPRGESHYGLSKLAAAREAIVSDWNALSWNRSFFNNATWPSGIIVSKDGFGPEELKKAREELRKNYEGKSKVGKIMILSGGLDWKQTTPNPKDLDFANLRRQSREDILAVLGVPPSIAGIYAFENSSGRSAGIREQSIFFWSQTVLPLVNKVLNVLNNSLVGEFAANYALEPDIKGIPQLRETEEALLRKAETYEKLVHNGWPLNKALSAVYPDEPPFPHGNAAFIEGKLTPITDINGDEVVREPNPSEQEVEPSDASEDETNINNEEVEATDED